MGQPTTVAGYEPEWALIAQHLVDQGNLTLPVGDKRKASTLRFRFYGFRKALATHDAKNPWLAALMETQATITPKGDVHFERSPFGALLRGIMEHSKVETPAPAATDEDHPIGEQHETTLLNFLTHKPLDKSVK